MKHVGLDVHQAETTVVWIDAETGEVLESEDSEEGMLKPEGEAEGYTIAPQGVTLDDGRVAAPRKFYVDGVPVYIVGEQAFELDAEDNVLRTVTFTDYVRDNVRRLSPTAEHLRETWPIAEQRAEIRLMRVVDRCRHRDNDEIRLGQRSGISADRQQRRRSQVVGRHFTRGIDVAGIARDLIP
jgi:hypothetical protein